MPLKVDANKDSINQVLRELDYTHKTISVGYKHAILKKGEGRVFTGDCAQVWQWLCDTKQIEFINGECQCLSCYKEEGK